ncbi:toll-like receptor 2 type-1 [Patiria miniata]|uniref:TIR domain-containing protein n=1 Tax=Patiria miniata TaxID=46514 RepID=A0A914ARZ6_PATMI|nr:toll-like receptor 2 type-1 [Patiria miniata]
MDGPPYLSASCEISSPVFFSYFPNVTEFPSEDYELELGSNVPVNQLVSIPEGTFASFSNSTPCCLGLYRFYNLAPISNDVFRGLRLQRVNFAGLGLESFPVEAIREQSTSLIKIDIFDVLTNKGGAILPPRFHSFEALQTITITNTPLKHLPNCSFSHLTALVHLQISHALLEDEDFPRLVLHDVPRLENLQLSHNGFTEIPAALTDLPSLKHLDLSHNEIKTLDARVLRDLQGLTELNLQGNRIEMVDSAGVEALRNMPSLEVFSLGSDSPFLCTCQLLPFVRWLHQSSIVIGSRSNFATYSCKNPPHLLGAELLSPDLVSYLESNCSGDTTTIPTELPLVNTTKKNGGGDIVDAFSPYRIVVPVVTVSVVLSIVGVISTWIMYKKLKRRWVGLFRRFDSRNLSRHATHQETEYRYDAYVCHHESATEFVVNEMIPEMEGEQDGFRLCLSFRDFLVGADQLDNVATAIDASRVVIVLLDADFITCGHCMLELNMTCTRTLEEGSLGGVPVASAESHHLLPGGTTGLLLVLLDALPVDALPTTLRVLLDKITCLEWNTEDAARCWQQLKSALQDTAVNPNLQQEHNFDITQPLTNLNLQPDDVMVSFDVVSLFTSIPTSDACTIAKDRLQADTTLQDRTDLTLTSFENCSSHVPTHPASDGGTNSSNSWLEPPWDLLYPRFRRTCSWKNLNRPTQGLAPVRG